MHKHVSSRYLNRDYSDAVECFQLTEHLNSRTLRLLGLIAELKSAALGSLEAVGNLFLVEEVAEL